MVIETVRDVAIIMLAGMSIVVAALLAILIWQIYSLVRLLKRELQPTLLSVKETTYTVRGTTTFMSKNFIQPLIKVLSYVSAIQDFWRALWKVKPRRDQKHREAESQDSLEVTSVSVKNDE